MSGLLQDYLAAGVKSNADRPAIVMGPTTLTYLDLERASNRLARLLTRSGCERHDRVCLLVEKSPDAIVAMLASLKAGCAYVPIDAHDPATRVARMLRSADPAAIVAAGAAAPLVEQLRADDGLPRGLPVIALDGESAAGEDSGPLPTVGVPEDAAHMLFTSGSTGEPKAVVITHANVRAFVDWAVRYFEIKPRERLSGHSPLHFDLSTFDVYGSLAAGAELHPVPTGTLLPRQLSEFITGHQLTQWFSVPSAMAYMSNGGAVPEAGFPTLERVMWCGDVLPTPVLAHWMERNPQATFTNLYGPTEATIASSYHTVRERPADASEQVPIGVACDGESLFVLGEDGNEAAEDEIGDLYISGAGLSPGYWRDPAKTEAAFIDHPLPSHGHDRAYRTGDLARRDRDGLIHFVGRADSQIKSRGYRIELGEVETAVNALDAIAECAVVGVPSEGFEGTAICCAFTVAAGNSGLSSVALRRALGGALPSYMLPSRWRELDFLPKNANGKTDRPVLRIMFTNEKPPRAQQ
jgi:amino acid adenylation domain-containing protein